MGGGAGFSFAPGLPWGPAGGEALELMGEAVISEVMHDVLPLLG